MSSIDYLNLCRLCLVKESAFVPIFDGEGDSRQIFHKIAACLPVKVTRDDKLPKKICNECVQKIELFYQFCNTTTNAEKQLLEWIGGVDLNDKQTYVSAVINQDQSSNNRLDGNVMQQTNEQHQNNIDMNMMESIGLEMPMMIQQNQTQMTINYTNNTNAQSMQSNTIAQQQNNSKNMEESDDDHCGGDDDMGQNEELSVKEEIQDSNRTIEPTFVSVSSPCEEAGPSGLQQKSGDIPDGQFLAGQSTDGDPKSGVNDVSQEDVSSSELNSSTLDSSMSTNNNTIEKNSSSSKKQKSNSCKTCNLNFSNDIDLLTHETVDDCTAEKTPAKKTSKKRKLLFNDENINHIKKRRITFKDDPFICYICNFRAKDQIELNNHDELSHVNNDCEFFTNTRIMFPLSESQTSNIYQRFRYCYNCLLCKKKFSNFVYLKNHTMRCHQMPTANKKYTCIECHFKTYYEHGYKEHMWSHANDNRIPCNICYKVLNRTYMSNHMKIHDGKKTEMCFICSRKFVTKKYLNTHMLSHSRNDKSSEQ